MNSSTAAALSLVIVAGLPACGSSSSGLPGDPGQQPDAALVDNGLPDGASLDAGADSSDAESPTCEATQNVEAVAAAVAERIRGEMEQAGFTVAGMSPVALLSPTQGDIERIHASRTEDAVYFGTEAEVLALPDGDRLREAYEDGDIPHPDWNTEGLLALFRLDPYTDIQFHRKDAELIVSLVRLEGCLATGVPPEPEPYELVRHAVYRVPKLEVVETRTESHAFLVAEFPAEPEWVAHPASPVIARSGAAGSVLRTADGYRIWVNGYSGASGFIFHGTSADGVSWDFSWETEDTCEFEGLDIFVQKRDPSVILDGDRFVMWLEIDTGSDYVTRIHRTESADGLHWSAPARVYGDGMRDLRAPFVAAHEGVFHLWGHDSGDRNIVHATSTDGMTWQMQGVVVERGESIDAMDGFGVFTPSAYHDGERWVLFYAAAYSPRELIDNWHQPVWHQMHLAYATSTDGIVWDKAVQPIWNQNRTVGHWESGNMGRPIPILDGGGLSIYYTGVERGEPSVGLLTRAVP